MSHTHAVYLDQDVIGQVDASVHVEECVEKVVIASLRVVALEDGIRVQRAIENREDVVGQQRSFEAVVEERFPRVVPTSRLEQSILHEASGLEPEADLLVRNGQEVDHGWKNPASEKIGQAVVQLGEFVGLVGEIPRKDFIPAVPPQSHSHSPAGEL